MNSETIEILSVDLLEQHRLLVEDLKAFTRSLGLELGWHYLLDLVWIINRLGNPRGIRILDAGAGMGVLQWYLADKGGEIISVDRTSRVDLPLRFRRRFNVEGLRQNDLGTNFRSFQTGLRRQIPGSILRRSIVNLLVQGREWIRFLVQQPAIGRVQIYNQDLEILADIPSGSIDAVVSVSALEHNTTAGLRCAVAEILRVLKPGGCILATLVAAGDQDVWHEPSKAWCYSESTLRQIFDLPTEAQSNYSQYDALFHKLRDCLELQNHLASFYFKSGSGGMPWGKWDPQYQPVGVHKFKPLIDNP